MTSLTDRVGMEHWSNEGILEMAVGFDWELYTA